MFRDIKCLVWCILFRWKLVIAFCCLERGAVKEGGEVSELVIINGLVASGHAINQATKSALENRPGGMEKGKGGGAPATSIFKP